MGICPENNAVDSRNGVKKMVMVVPINRQVNEAQYVTDEIRKYANKGRPTRPVRHFQLEDHDRDDDGDDTITECGETIFSHSVTPRQNALEQTFYYKNTPLAGMALWPSAS
jgi:hypothetical protein